MRTLLQVLLMVIFFSLPIQAEAATILWDFEGVLSARTDDVLGINGESVQLNIEFDTADVWAQGSDFLGAPALYFPSVAASTSITGAHTIASRGILPAASYFDFLGTGGMREGMNNQSYVDFIIDGVITETFSPNGPSLLSPPSVGENLLLSHLRDDLGVIASFKVRDVFYDFADISITTSFVSVPVPEPATMILISTGLLGLGLKRKK